MTMAQNDVLLLLLLFFIGVHFATSSANTLFILQNNCPYTVWPAAISGNGDINGGAVLIPNDNGEFSAEPGWSGRIWARTGCHFDVAGDGHCDTGDCGGKLECAAAGEPPATLVEFTLGSEGGTARRDFYDVSLVDGYNVGIAVRPSGGAGDCRTVACAADVNAICLKELQVVDKNGEVVACKSACVAFQSSEFCCTGEHANPNTCKPTSYSKIFKNACPKAYSYAYDDRSSINTCRGADYFITFCPSKN